MIDPTKTQEVLNQCIQHYNNYGINKEYFHKKQQLTEIKSIVEKEKKRLGIKNPRITMEQIGFDEIKNEENLYNLAEKNQIKITKICSNTHNKVTVAIKAEKPVIISLEAGTMLFPDEPLADNTQSLMLRDDLSTAISET